MANFYHIHPSEVSNRVDNRFYPWNWQRLVTTSCHDCRSVYIKRIDRSHLQTWGHVYYHVSTQIHRQVATPYRHKSPYLYTHVSTHGHLCKHVTYIPTDMHSCTYKDLYPHMYKHEQGHTHFHTCIQFTCTRIHVSTILPHWVTEENQCCAPSHTYHVIVFYPMPL